MPISKLTSLPFPPPAVPPFSASGQGLVVSVNQLIDMNVASLKSLTATPQTDTVYNVIAFYAGWAALSAPPSGGGLFAWNPTLSKSNHNGVTHYAPEALSAWAGTQTDIATLLNWTGMGSGVWVRTDISVLTPYHAGGVPSFGMDCTLPMQKVITYLGNNGGGKLRLPAGTWDITAQIDMASQSVVIEGDSRFASLIKQKTLNTKALNITGIFCGIKSLSIIYDGTPANGATAIYVTSSYVTLEDFVIRSSYEGVYFDGGNAVAGKVTNFEILDYVAIGLHAKGLNDLFVDNFIINAGSDTRGALGGIRLENKVEAFICSNGDILMGAYSMTMEAVSNTLGNRPAYNNFTNVFFDSAVNPTQINECVETDFVGCWFSGGRFGGGNSGAVVSSSRSVRFTNTRFFNCGGSGVLVNNTSTDVTFTNCKAESNSVTAGDGVTHGFQFADGTQEFKVIGCTASNGLYTGKQGYGIFIGVGCDKFNIVENNLIGNFTGPLLDGTSAITDKTVMDNRGYNRGGMQDYTPVVEGSSTSGVGTYSVQVGKFQEFGDVVFFTAAVTWSAHTGTGGTRITLPHSLADFGQRVPLSVYYSDLTVGASKEVGAFAGTSGNVLVIRALDTAGGAVAEFFDAAGSINISGFYRRA